MGLFSFFKRNPISKQPTWWCSLSEDGIHFHREEINEAKELTEISFSGFLTQLRDDDLVHDSAEGDHVISWNNFYNALALPGYDEMPEALSMPPFTSASPVLTSRNALSDSDFSISLGSWRDRAGQSVSPRYVGPLLKLAGKYELMTAYQWDLFKRVQAFAARPVSEKTDQQQRLSWGHIRRSAVAAGAVLNDFLVKTVVLTPDRLDIQFRKSDVAVNDTVVEVIPSFEGAPDNWLEQFDRFDATMDRYDLPTHDGGLVQVILSPDVKTVLREIKRFDHRRLAGSRAQAFLLNPYATLGEAANTVIDEEQFEKAREDAGIEFERFSPLIERSPDGYPEKVTILIESASSKGALTASRHPMDESSLKSFVACIERSFQRGFQLAFWEGVELEILGDTEEHLNQLKEVLEQWCQPKTLVNYADVHDLSHYSSRIEGIGLEKPIYSPFISRKAEDEGWFPENVLPVVAFTPEGQEEPLAIPVNAEALATLKEATQKAIEDGKDAVELPWLPTPMPVDEAKKITGTFDEVLEDVKNKVFDPEKRQASKPAPRKTLVLKDNINTVEYDEQRRKALTVSTSSPCIPQSINPSFPLLSHQLEGVARLQHLYNLRHEYQVRGMLLADDMGLGKTFQLLTLATSVFERAPDTKPMLVVAPVSLLENWKEEAEKFFPGALRILTAYGDTLVDLRVPRESVDVKLRTEDGLVRFLCPGWIGEAQLVLTTYETLRDLEFSFALQQWSLMVCDEAQKIKNPAAMVTRSAKKQNAEFKIACTGTPVENTLADLWCLFDFVQPGLLGALNDFGTRYRRPIEIDERDEEGQKRVKELREMIEPQILRRTKLEVAKDLPKKIVVDSCRRLPISPEQRNFYAKAISDFKRRAEPNFQSPFKNHLGFLHYLRLICTDPRRHGLTVFKPAPISQYRSTAPKLDWLLKQLEDIKNKGEKAIVFCEFRNIQRLLQHYIQVALGFEADIINGDTSASSSHTASRQKRIKSFQAKPGFGVIILSPVAVGFGVNIQAANHVVHYTRTWNPAKEDQASDRAWRIGQTKEVYVYYPVVAADDFTTFDVKLDQLLERKRSLAGDMLNGSPDISMSEFKVEDVVPSSDAANLDERVSLDDAMLMEWRHFEGLAAALWSKMGYDIVYCTPGSSDNGVDVVAIRGDRGVLIQTKTSAAEERAMNWDTVKEVVAGEAYYCRRHPGVQFEKVGLTNQRFNSQAHENALLNNVRLLDKKDLAEMLDKYTTTMLDVERMIYTQFYQGLSAY